MPCWNLGGAPKPRALEIIDSLEPAQRVFTGSRFDFAGDADLAIAIQMRRPQRQHSVCAGWSRSCNGPVQKLNISKLKTKLLHRTCCCDCEYVKKIDVTTESSRTRFFRVRASALLLIGWLRRGSSSK
jgi:hypothetical protein